MRPSDGSTQETWVRWGPELPPPAPWAYERVPGAAAPFRAGITPVLPVRPGSRL